MVVREGMEEMGGREKNRGFGGMGERDTQRRDMTTRTGTAFNRRMLESCLNLPGG